MLFIVLFEDDSDQLPVRNALMNDHLAYLAQHPETIRIAGSLRDIPEAAPIGGCWVVEAGSKAEVDKLCRDDPFWRGGLRRKHTILHWSKAFDKLVPI